MPPNSPAPADDSAAASPRLDAVSGVLSRADGTRLATLPPEAVQGLHFTLVELASENAADILYRSGYEWALGEMVETVRQRRAAGHAEDWDQARDGVLEGWWERFEDTGWGAAEFDLSQLHRGLAFVRLHQSAVVRTLGHSEDPLCHLYAGLFAGAVSFLLRIERHAAEIQCAAVGGDACVFVVGPGPDVDAAESWRQQGVTATEILRRIHA